MVSVPGPLQVDPKLFVTENGTPLGRLLSFDELCQLTRMSEPAMRAKIGAGIGPPVIQKRRWAKIFCWEGKPSSGWARASAIASGNWRLLKLKRRDFGPRARGDQKARRKL